MNNERIETALRSCAAPEMPDGMRDRVLARAQAEAQPGMLRQVRRHWRGLLIAAMLIAAVGSGMLDAARQRRIDLMLFGAASTAAGSGQSDRAVIPGARPNDGRGGGSTNAPTRTGAPGGEMHLMMLAMAYSAARNPEGGG
jgi:hypothetical protein